MEEKMQNKYLESLNCFVTKKMCSLVRTVKLLEKKKRKSLQSP